MILEVRQFITGVIGGAVIGGVWYSVYYVVVSDLDDKKKVCDLFDEGKDELKDAGWETYWGKVNMKLTMNYTFFSTLKLK